MNLTTILVVLALPIASIAAVLGAMNLWLFLQKRRRNRSPIKGDFLRSPGESLRKSIEDQQLEFLGLFTTAAFLPIWFPLVYLAQNFDKGHDPVIAIIFGIFLLGAMTYVVLKMLRTLSRLKANRLGLDGETATGQELNQLMRHGCYVFHDIEAEYGNVDHIVVGPGGVFAVETKARSKPVTGDGKKDATAHYDGRRIEFPHFFETDALEQARLQSKWASKWLSRSTGEPVKVCPVVALPGWYVDRTGSSNVLVLNPREDKTFMTKPGRHGNLDSGQITRIVYQIERENRNIAPNSRKHD